MTDLHPDWLTALMALADHGSFSAAARALHRSQPAVHGQVQKLAGALDVTLYVRRGRGVELSAEGRRVVAHAREVQASRTELACDLAGESSGARVTLAAGEGALLYLLGDVIRREQRRRTATLRLLVRDAPSTREAVESGEAHVGVLPLEAVPSSLEAEVLRDVGLVVLAPPDHGLNRKRRLRVRDLVDHPLIVPPRGAPLRDRLEASAGVPLTATVEARGWPLALSLAHNGVGLAVVNDYCTVPRGLVALPLRDGPRQLFHKVRRRGAPRSAACERLFEQLG